METEKEINAIILAITMEIQAKRPELTMTLGEMPVTYPTGSNQKINRKALTDYYDSLKSILKEYK